MVNTRHLLAGKAHLVQVPNVFVQYIPKAEVRGGDVQAMLAQRTGADPVVIPEGSTPILNQGLRMFLNEVPNSQHSLPNS